MAKAPGATSGRHWAEVLLNRPITFLHTPNINRVTYELMIEDERQYRIAEASAKSGTLLFDPDAKLKAQYLKRGRDFPGELQRYQLVWK